jgi:hypothetical protein
LISLFTSSPIAASQSSRAPARTIVNDYYSACTLDCMTYWSNEETIRYLIVVMRSMTSMMLLDRGLPKSFFEALKERLRR